MPVVSSSFPNCLKCPLQLAFSDSSTALATGVGASLGAGAEGIFKLSNASCIVNGAAFVIAPTEIAPESM